MKDREREREAGNLRWSVCMIQVGSIIDPGHEQLVAQGSQGPACRSDGYLAGLRKLGGMISQGASELAYLGNLDPLDAIGKKEYED